MDIIKLDIAADLTVVSLQMALEKLYEANRLKRQQENKDDLDLKRLFSKFGPPIKLVVHPFQEDYAKYIRQQCGWNYLPYIIKCEALEIDEWFIKDKDFIIWGEL